MTDNILPFPSKRPATGFKTRWLHPETNALPHEIRIEILHEFKDIAMGRDCWVCSDKAGTLLRVDVWESAPGAFNWRATYSDTLAPQPA